VGMGVPPYGEDLPGYCLNSVRLNALLAGC